MDRIISLEQCRGLGRELVGGKAANLSELIHEGFSVPGGVCVTAPVYLDFIKAAGIKDAIFYELGRKNLEDMRWEEMWDASLRIRNIFLRKDMPGHIENDIVEILKSRFKNKLLAVRSSSNFEDSEINSYAGLHESFLNLKDKEDVLKHIKLVWASLWSDAAIAYSRELGLDPARSMMSVIIQELVYGTTSGVAFSISPVDPEKAVIEAVPGLNKGLVDGDVEPDRWDIARSTGDIARYLPSKENRKTVMDETGVKIIELNDKKRPLLSTEKVKGIYRILMDLEKKLGFPADLEWTIKEGNIYLLQVRPVSGTKFDDKNQRRGWDMTLRRSFDNLKRLSIRITGELLPEMQAEADILERSKIDMLDGPDLAAEVEKRKNIYEKWKGIYWDEFIPFAHGARLFGKVYNDRMKPEDPYEFVDIISADKTESRKRNNSIKELAEKLIQKPGSVSREGEILDGEFKETVKKFMEKFPGLAGSGTDEHKKEQFVLSVIKKYAETPDKGGRSNTRNNKKLEEAFLDTFEVDEKTKGRELIDLGKLSYKLRDDDNVYLGRFETELSRAMNLSRSRLGELCRDERSCQAAEEVIMALKVPGYAPKRISEKGKDDTKGGFSRKRQLRGQPAGQGIARGTARIINKRDDLLKIENGDILVCDSIDPEMTFIIPVVGGIVERRGGMLIHGAIIAREYGVPCVTGVEGATGHIKNGDDITIDGYFGLVINHSVQ